MEPDGDLPGGPVVADSCDRGSDRFDLPGAIQLLPLRGIEHCVPCSLEGAPWPIPVTIYGDASGNSRTTKSTRTDYELIQDIFDSNPRYRIALRENTANPAVRDRVNTVNSMLKSASGSRNIFIHPELPGSSLKVGDSRPS
jgi:hypothetical protein